MARAVAGAEAEQDRTATASQRRRVQASRCAQLAVAGCTYNLTRFGRFTLASENAVVQCSCCIQPLVRPWLPMRARAVRVGVPERSYQWHAFVAGPLQPLTGDLSPKFLPQAAASPSQPGPACSPRHEHDSPSSCRSSLMSLRESQKLEGRCDSAFGTVRLRSTCEVPQRHDSFRQHAAPTQVKRQFIGV